MTVLYTELVQLPPLETSSSDPLVEGVFEGRDWRRVDWWGLICELLLVLGAQPLEVGMFVYKCEAFVIVLNNTSEATRELRVMECSITDARGQRVMRTSPWESTFYDLRYDFEALRSALEAEVDRLLEVEHG